MAVHNLYSDRPLPPPPDWAAIDAKASRYASARLILGTCLAFGVALLTWVLLRSSGGWAWLFAPVVLMALLSVALWEARPAPARFLLGLVALVTTGTVLLNNQVIIIMVLILFTGARW